MDGIALAIELAAAQIYAFGIHELLTLLSDDNRVPPLRGRRTAPARHQTLRATLNWSYELLTPTERMVLRRLAVFVGGATIDSAVGVLADVDLLSGEKRAAKL